MTIKMKDDTEAIDGQQKSPSPAPDRFVIDRRIWLRGKFGSSLLRSADGKMCCLGQILSQGGVPTSYLWDKPYPMSVRDVMPASLRAFLLDADFRISNSLLANEAMKINDSRRMTDEEREQRLTTLFASHGITLEFIN